MEGIISFEDKKYPEGLKGIKNPPKNIYYKGRVILNQPCLAVIGSRDYSIQNKPIVLKIIKGLPQQVVIVSGLARGIDSLAHSAALKSEKRTIAVFRAVLKKYIPKKTKTWQTK